MIRKNVPKICVVITTINKDVQATIGSFPFRTTAELTWVLGAMVSNIRVGECMLITNICLYSLLARNETTARAADKGSKNALKSSIQLVFGHLYAILMGPLQNTA